MSYTKRARHIPAAAGKGKLRPQRVQLGDGRVLTIGRVALSAAATYVRRARAQDGRHDYWTVPQPDHVLILRSRPQTDGRIQQQVLCYSRAGNPEWLDCRLTEHFCFAGETLDILEGVGYE